MAAPDRTDQVFSPVSVRSAHRTILLAHGGGGQMTDQLLQELILPPIANDTLNELLDSAILPLDASCRLALTIDSYVVQPLEFPGGDIGRLAVCGTVNDLAVCGARPLGVALSLILTEGLDCAVLERLMASVARSAEEAGVRIVTGDTKVVGRGQADGLFVTTAGVGLLDPQRCPHPERVQPGDCILINGPVADHGLAVMLARQMPQVHSALESDVAPLNGLIEQLWQALDPRQIHFMRDPTRGGLAAVAADLARQTGLCVLLEEPAIPVRPQTRHAAEMLGLDVLEVANEGKVVLVVAPEAAETALKILRQHPLGTQAAVIGSIHLPAPGTPARAELRTELGGRRILQKPYGEQLPRIC